jgi:hypothetical protein
MLCNKWEGLLAELERRRGSGTEVAVFPCASLQMDANIMMKKRFDG